MENCPTCEERNPATIVYSKAVPLVNANCTTCGVPFQIPNVASSGNGLPVEIVAGDQTAVADLSDSTKWKFIVGHNPDIAMTAVLTLVAKVATVVQGVYVLFGKAVDEVNLSWVYSKPNDVSIQTLKNGGGLAEPTLGLLDVVHDYTGQNIQSDIAFTISGDDGNGKPESIGVDVKSVLFGNYRGQGDGVRLDSGSTTTAAMIVFIEGLISGGGTVEIDVNRLKTALTASGGNLEHFYYFFPKAWDFATFTQNGIPGGMKRLGAVGGLIVDVPLSSYEAGEQEIQISNGFGSEAYHIYQSPQDNINGAIFAVT